MSTASDRFANRIVLIFFAAWAGVQSGCCQHDYYVQGCPPGTSAQPAVIRYGSVCEAPAPGGTVIGQSPSQRPSTAGQAPSTRPRVVISEPGPRLANRPGWRRSDPDSFATTRVEGPIDEDSINR